MNTKQMTVTVHVFGMGYQEVTVGLVTVEEPRDTICDGRNGRSIVKAGDVYRVVSDDGRTLGTVQRIIANVEHRTPGRRYVNRRWERAEWRWVGVDSKYRTWATSKKSAVAYIVEDAIRNNALAVSA